MAGAPAAATHAATRPPAPEIQARRCGRSGVPACMSKDRAPASACQPCLGQAQGGRQAPLHVAGRNLRLARLPPLALLPIILLKEWHLLLLPLPSDICRKCAVDGYRVDPATSRCVPVSGTPSAAAAKAAAAAAGGGDGVSSQIVGGYDAQRGRWGPLAAFACYLAAWQLSSGEGRRQAGNVHLAPSPVLSPQALVYVAS